MHILMGSYIHSLTEVRRWFGFRAKIIVYLYAWVMKFVLVASQIVINSRIRLQILVS